MEKTDFTKLARCVSANFADNFAKIKEVSVRSSIISIEEFYENFNSKALEKACRLPAVEQESSIEDFAAIFKSFEYYPENIKPKKVISRELSRMNSTLRNHTFASVTENTTLHVEDPSCSAQVSTDFGELEQQESAVHIYKKYEEFKRNLDKLMERSQRLVTFAAEYATKLQQVNIFAQQLEKLLPTQCMGKQAFSREHEIQLEMIVADMKRLCYLQNNQDIFGNMKTNSAANSSSQRLEGLVEVLSHSLISISCYNEI